MRHEDQDGDQERCPPRSKVNFSRDQMEMERSYLKTEYSGDPFHAPATGLRMDATHTVMLHNVFIGRVSF